MRNHYKQKGEVKNGIKGLKGDIIADITTSFTILLAIFFPSVTGINYFQLLNTGCPRKRDRVLNWNNCGNIKPKDQSGYF